MLKGKRSKKKYKTGLKLSFTDILFKVQRNKKIAEYFLENGRFLSAKCSTNIACACDLKVGELLLTIKSNV